jgi:hypothetical protein
MLEVLKTIEEQSKFALLYQIVSGEEAEVATDNENYVIARNKKILALWFGFVLFGANGRTRTLGLSQ